MKALKHPYEKTPQITPKNIKKIKYCDILPVFFTGATGSRSHITLEEIWIHP